MENVKRLDRDDPESYLICIIYKEALKHPKDGQWRELEATIAYCGRKYYIRAEFVLRDSFLTYKNLQVKALDKDLIILN